MLLNHIFDALTALGCLWKQIPNKSYRFRCKLSNSIKFELQIYKCEKDKNKSNYLIDLFLLSGNIMDFLSFVQNFDSLLKKSVFIVINSYFS